MSKTWTKKG